MSSTAVPKKPRRRQLSKKQKLPKEKDTKKDKDCVKYITFSGGGGRGWTYWLVLRLLENNYPKFKLENIEKVAGSSAGAICALAVALNFSSEELDLQILKNPGLKFLGSFSHSLRRIISGKSWYDSAFLRAWIVQLIEGRTGLKDPTFGTLYAYSELQKNRGLPGIKDLFVAVTTANALWGARDYFSAADKEVKVADAVVASCSVPVIFSAVSSGVLLFVDAICGGRNNPFKIFEEMKIPVKPHQLLNFVLVSRSIIPKLFGKIESAKWGYRQFVEVIMRALNHDTYNATAAQKRNMIFVPIPPSVGILDFGWSHAQWSDGIMCAKEAVYYFMKKRIPVDKAQQLYLTFFGNEKSSFMLSIRAACRKFVNSCISLYVHGLVWIDKIKQRTSVWSKPSHGAKILVTPASRRDERLPERSEERYREAALRRSRMVELRKKKTDTNKSLVQRCASYVWDTLKLSPYKHLPESSEECRNAALRRGKVIGFSKEQMADRNKSLVQRCASYVFDKFKRSP